MHNRKIDKSVIHIRVDKKTKLKWHIAVKIAARLDKTAGDIFKDMLEFYTSRVEAFRDIDKELPKYQKIGIYD